MPGPVATFYDYPLAFNPAKAKLVLLEKQFPFKNQVTDIFNGQSLSPAFLKINPHGTVPVLVDGDVTITESRKILEYVDSKDGKPLGGSTVDRQKVTTWLDKIDPWNGNLFFFANLPADVAKTFGGLGEYKVKYAEARAKSHPELAQVYAEKIAGMKAFGATVADPAAVAANKQALVALLDEAEAALASTKFLAGDEYSIADAAFTAILYRIVAVGKAGELFDPRPKVKAYYDALKQRKSFDKTFGVSSSNFKTTLLVLPSIFKAWRAKTLHWY